MVILIYFFKDSYLPFGKKRKKKSHAITALFCDDVMTFIPTQPAWNPKEAETKLVTVRTVLVPVEPEKTCPQCCHSCAAACSVAGANAEHFYIMFYHHQEYFNLYHKRLFWY